MWACSLVGEGYDATRVKCGEVIPRLEERKKDCEPETNQSKGGSWQNRIETFAVARGAFG